MAGTRRGRRGTGRQANRMTTPRAALHVASESEGGVGGRLSELSRDQDPLRRLEAELQSVDGGHPDVERLYEQAWGLLEEAWGLVTDCLVMRDGLLDACAEIERTMDAVNRRLQALASPVELPAGERSTAGGRHAVQGFNGAAVP